MSRFFCLWIQDFPAWAAVREDMSLRDKPVLVYSSGHIIAVSPEARAAGAQVGWTINRAKAQLPEAAYLPHYAPTTQAAWESVLETLYSLTPRIEAVRPGLALADIRPVSRISPYLRKWNACGGLADDRTTAELAAYTAGPGKGVSVPRGGSRAFLRTVPISLLAETGIEANTLERLEWFGWDSVGKLTPLTRQQLAIQFQDGATLYRYAQAKDLHPLPAYKLPPVISASYAFEIAVRQPYEVEPVLALLIENAFSQLDQRDPHSLSIGIECRGRWRYHHRLLRDEVINQRTLREMATRGLAGLLGPRVEVSTLTVRLSGLAQRPGVQQSLFDPQRPTVERVMRALQARFPAALCRIKMLDSEAYLPEEGFRLEPVGSH